LINYLRSEERSYPTNPDCAVVNAATAFYCRERVGRKDAKKYERALIIGAGVGLSASLARLFASRGISGALAAHSVADLAPIAAETGASLHQCDAAGRASQEAQFADVDKGDAPDVGVYNASARVAGSFVEIDPDAVEAAGQVTALGAFHAAQLAAERMEPASHSAILFKGASAGVKGFLRSAAFAMGKFAMRGNCTPRASILAIL
jgi:NAD(P)-dependent dehydrogenase (short-subunit alcohol dehydrogenase family)